MRTSAVTLCVPSLTSPSTPVCECASMMPGVTCLPRPSTSSAPAGALRLLPTAVILPSTARTSAFSRIPAGPCVQTVAPRTTTALGDATGPSSRAGRGRTSGSGAFSRLFARPAAPAGPARASRSRELVPLPVDPDLRDLALLREGLARLDDEVGDLAGVQGPEARLETELPRRDRRDRRERVVLRQAPRQRLPDATAEIFRVVEAGGREGKGQAGVLHPLRVRRRPVDAAQPLQRHVRPFEVVVQAVGPREVHLEDEVGLERRDFSGQAVLVSRADVARLQLEFLCDLRGAQQRQDVRRLEDDRLAALRRRDERRVGRGQARTGLAGRVLRVGRRGVPPPERVEQGLPDQGDSAHLGHRVDAARPKLAKSKRSGSRVTNWPYASTRMRPEIGPSARLTTAPRPRRMPAGEPPPRPRSPRADRSRRRDRARSAHRWRVPLPEPSKADELPDPMAGVRRRRPVLPRPERLPPPALPRPAAAAGAGRRGGRPRRTDR